jgi:hypothetical protein
MNEDWDVMMVFDACRYDYFANLYGYYLEGKLIKTISKGSFTLEWAKKTFIERYLDTIYVSANPYINSRWCIDDFCAGIKFYKVIDAWDKHWDDKLGTVIPDNVTYEAMKAYLYYRGKRLIIHYLQPHAPYITCPCEGYVKPNVNVGQILKSPKVENSLNNPKIVWLLTKVPSMINFLTIKFLDIGNGYSWRVRELLRLPPASPMDACRRKYGIIGLRKCYEDNLRIVIEAALPFIEELLDNGLKVVITADHGEFLGELGGFEHWSGSKRAILRVVPYFIVKDQRKDYTITYSCDKLRV